MFVEEAKNRLSQDDPRSSQGDQRLHEDDPGLYRDQQDQSLSRPMARAFSKTDQSQKRCFNGYFFAS